MLRKIFLFLFPVRCKDCHQVKPSFAFITNGWQEGNLCRKCYNKLLGEDYYISFIESLRFSFGHFIKGEISDDLNISKNTHIHCEICSKVIECTEQEFDNYEVDSICEECNKEVMS